MNPGQASLDSVEETAIASPKFSIKPFSQGKVMSIIGCGQTEFLSQRTRSQMQVVVLM
jgi:hypothetical protein